MATTPETPEKMTLDRSDGSATIDLYRAALGPVRADYYLKAFTRFDAAGTSGPSWNWAAALLSLNWMLYRKLWTLALAYLGALMAAILLILGIGKLIFQLSEETQWMLTLLGLVLAIALPGTYGNAWLYAACNRKMQRALETSETLEEACALLSRGAGGVKRMVSLAGLNASLALIVAALALSWPQPGDSLLHAGTAPAAQPKIEMPSQSASAVAVPSQPAASQSSQASAVQTAAASAPSTPQAVASIKPDSQSPDKGNNQSMVQEGAAAAAALAQPVPAAAVSAPEPAATTAPAATTHVEKPAKTKKSVPPASVQKEEKVGASSTASKTANPSKAERLAKAKADKADKAEKAAKAATKAAEKSLAENIAATANAQGSDKYLINVGLFADDNNAHNAFVKLQDAGLPALSQEIKSSKGKRTRVRVGPFETQAEADRAAERIRALQLDAVVFKQ